MLKHLSLKNIKNIILEFIIKVCHYRELPSKRKMRHDMINNMTILQVLYSLNEQSLVPQMVNNTPHILRVFGLARIL